MFQRVKQMISWVIMATVCQQLDLILVLLVPFAIWTRFGTVVCSISDSHEGWMTTSAAAECHPISTADGSRRASDPRRRARACPGPPPPCSVLLAPSWALYSPANGQGILGRPDTPSAMDRACFRSPRIFVLFCPWFRSSPNYRLCFLPGITLRISPGNPAGASTLDSVCTSLSFNSLYMTRGL